MGDPLVSVVIPTYNRAYCLERTLSSALSQTYRNLEIVVVDDGSTDTTEELMTALGRRDGRVRYIKQANKGVAAARRPQGLARTRHDLSAHGSLARA